MTSSERVSEIVAELASTRGQDLITLAYLLTGDGDEAEDIVQAVLARLLGSSSIARATNPFAYAKRAVTNEFLDRRRRLQRRARALVILRSEPATIGSVDTPIAERDALLRAFAVLKTRERACIVLRYYGDWDDASIAAAIGSAPATVRSLVSRALPRLRAALEQSEAASTPASSTEGDQ
ncbi:MULTISPECIES: sigma-70 family RNA polymerase sigma factor [Nocardioides]|uniref:Sigma-70 family RNA polymerase sigma factor n=1 Tax=Nocardioides vastitatis TaxID=2568655 RepID=A0ABW0ZL04_9ACTN|nr:sigma-70 family RNA polymerase sigma factor [Nocardioides sp.]THJ06245.1 sigma-70 family RNA polymerase sigma factor [Nocardioides sp.]